MQDVLSIFSFILVNGVSYGVILFTMSIGLVIMLGLMHVVNLAHGAFAAIGGYVTVSLMNAHGVPFLAAVAVAVVAVAALSLIVERLFYVHLYESSELEQVLLTIGLVFVAIASLNLLFGPDPLPSRLPAFLAQQVDLGLRKVQAYRLFVVLVGALLMLALWLLFERTSFGARLRAAVDNRTMAQVVGIDVRKVYSMAFALGCVLAALGGAVGYPMLPLEPLYPFKYLTLILIVVTLSGFGNVKSSAIAAIGVGIAETACRYLLPEFGSVVIYIVLLAVVVWRSRGTLISRVNALEGVLSSNLLERRPDWIFPAVFLGLALLTVFVFSDSLSFAASVLIMVLFALSLDFVLGYAGIVSLGHALFFGVGAYVAGLLALAGLREAITGMLLAGASAALLGAVVGPLVLRLTGLPQIMATLALGVIGFEAANKAGWLTGGDNGLQGIELAPLLGLFKWSVYGHTGYLYALVVLVLSFCALRVVIASSFGVALQGIRENRQRMMVIGAPVLGHTVRAYAIGAFFAGVAGALSAQTTRFVGLDVLSLTTSVDVMVMLTLGGVGRLYGALVGAPVYMVIHHFAAEWNPYHWMFVVGFLLIFVMRFSRGGLVGMAEGLWGRWRPLLMREPRKVQAAQEPPVGGAPRAGAETAG
jgi:branched-chain amino acid transport system permease protein